MWELDSIFIHFLIAFLVGSLPFGWVIARLWGVADLRTVGSQNVGATNVVRTAGKVPGVLTFFLDALKGFLPVFYWSDTHHAVWCGVFAVVGHCYSPWLRFKGGKGVSTILGVAFAYSWKVGLTAIASYALSFAFYRISAMGSLYALLSILASVWFISVSNTEVRLPFTIMVFLILLRHQKNWEALLQQRSSFHNFSVLFFSFIALSDGWATPPQRVVALTPSLAESLFELGQENRVVGIPEFTSLPAPLKKKIEGIGPYHSPSIKKIFQLKPDCVLADTELNSRQTLNKLRELKMNVLTFNTSQLKELLSSLERISQLFEVTSSEKIQKFRAFVHRPTPALKKTAFFQIANKPLISIGAGSFIHEVFLKAGLRNIFDDIRQSYPQINLAAVLKRNPDIILISQRDQQDTSAQQSLSFWNQFDQLNAVQTKKVYLFPGNLLTKAGLNLMHAFDELVRISSL